jgi:hypothetical protein
MVKWAYRTQWAADETGRPSSAGMAAGSPGSTNLIDNGHSALRGVVRRVRHWQSGTMAVRWTAAAFDAISEKFRRIMGHAELWMLKAALDEKDKDRCLADQAKAG